MFLIIGSRLGPYEIVAPLGAGGMSEVYRARDTRLDRVVAIKVLREHVADDPGRRARFEREARLISQLHHPHICTLYDVGQHGNTDYLVLECLEGETLAERLTRSKDHALRSAKDRGLPLQEALTTAIQIADALDSAHRQGIVHRDVKPSNVFLTTTGAKLLDFGIARMKEGASGNGVAGSDAVLATLTVEGVLLGTVQYMAPEQLEGREADARSDLFAFGAVLYEMLTGRRAFDGQNQSALIAAVLDSDTPAATSNPLLKNVVARCLAKDPEERWQTAADLKRELSWIRELALQDHAAAVPVTRTRRRIVRVSIVAATLTGLIVGALASGRFAGLVGRRASDDGAMAGVARVFLDIAPAGNIGRPARTAVALSPDGRTVVFSAIQGNRPQLYLRGLDQVQATPIAGTVGAVQALFSPDGRSIAFYAGGELRRVAVNGGPPVTICKISEAPFGASWGSDDRIVFGREAGGLWQVPASGGTPETLTTLDKKRGEVSHRLPHVLPQADAVLFTVTRNRFPRWDETEIGVYSRRTGVRTAVVRGGADARYVSSGHVVYAREGTLAAAPFDPRRLQVTGPAVGLIGDLMQAAYAGGSLADSGAAQFDVSLTGTLAYLPGGVVPPEQRSLVWVDRKGREERLPIPSQFLNGPRLSPDGQRLAVTTVGRNRDIWTFDISRGTFTRLTTADRNGLSVWTPDGRRVAYSSGIVGPDSLFWRAADGVGPPERLTTSENNQVPAGWSPDGHALAFYEFVLDAPNASTDLWILSLEGKRQPTSLIHTIPFTTSGADFSPDGKWLAYASDESGRNEVYVRPYPGPGGRRQVSTDGGMSPVWRRDGRELFYVVPMEGGDLAGRLPASVLAGGVVSVPVSLQPVFHAGSPTTLFHGRYLVNWPARAYDVSADGKRFLMVTPDEQTRPKTTQINLVLNWLEELKRLVPSNH